MDRIEVMFRLPRDLYEEAVTFGILTDAAIALMIDKELDRQRKLVDFFDTLDRLQKLEPKITFEEIEAEIEAYRREKRERRAAEASASLPPEAQSPPATKTQPG